MNDEAEKARGERYAKRTELRREERTHIIPVGFGKLDGRGSPLYSSAVDEDMDLSSHRLERELEEALYGVEVCQVALDRFDRPSEGGDRVQSLVVGRTRSADEADVGSRLGKGNCAGGADACEDGC